MEEIKIVPPVIKTDNFLVSLLSILLLISVFIAGFFAYKTQELVKEITKLKSVPTPVVTATPTPIETSISTSSAIPKPTMVACTMEAKVCPDGSYVGRSGPKCEFTPCPTPKS